MLTIFDIYFSILYNEFWEKNEFLHFLFCPKHKKNLDVNFFDLLFLLSLQLQAQKYSQLLFFVIQFLNQKMQRQQKKKNKNKTRFFREKKKSIFSFE